MFAQMEHSPTLEPPNAWTVLQESTLFLDILRVWIVQMERIKTILQHLFVTPVPMEPFMLWKDEQHFLHVDRALVLLDATTSSLQENLWATFRVQISTRHLKLTQHSRSFWNGVIKRSGEIVKELVKLHIQQQDLFGRTVLLKRFIFLLQKLSFGGKYAMSGAQFYFSPKFEKRGGGIYWLHNQHMQTPFFNLCLHFLMYVLKSLFVHNPTGEHLFLYRSMNRRQDQDHWDGSSTSSFVHPWLLASSFLLKI
jgi:hypothetical protein